MMHSRNPSLAQMLFARSKHVIHIIWRNEPGWPLVDVSESVERVLGYSVEQLHCDDFAYAKLIHPDDLSRVSAEVEQYFGDHSVEEFVHQDYRLKHADGHYVWVEDSTVLRRNEAGEVDLILGLIIDVSRRHQAEQQLRFNSERLQLVLQGTRLGMWDWNPQNNDVAFDQRWAEMLGLTLEDLSMSLEDWESRVHPDDLAACFNDITAHMEGKTAFYENLHRMRHKDGRWLYILDRGRVVEWDEQGRPIRFTGTHTDVTPLKLAEQAAQEALQSKDRFFSTLSHEIRTPLHGILGITDVLLEEMKQSSEVKYLEVLKNSGEYLLSLLNDALDVSKINAEKLKLELVDFSLLTELQQLEGLFAAKAQQKGITLKVSSELPAHWAYIRLDKRRFAQVLNNLVSNAIKFTDHGEVKVRVEAEGKDLLIHIEDSGQGMSDLNAVFEEFHQEQGNRSATSGTGLGLHLVKMLCDLMDVQIEVVSELGQGSCFTLRLKPEMCGAQAKTSDKLPQLSDLGFKQILLVDDDEVNRLVGRKLVESLGIHCHTLADPRLVASYIQQNTVDLVFMDLHMPEQNGDALFQDLKKEFSHLPPVVALTADAEAETKQSCMSIGMLDLLPKPFNRAQLSQALLSYRKRLSRL